MKKALSFFLCIVMCISMFSVTATEVYAAGVADKLFSVAESSVRNGEITYTIKLKSGITGFGGAILNVEFDNAVLEPTEDCAPATSSSGAQLLKGMYTHGITKNDPNTYTIAYMNNSPENFSSATSFFTMKFKVIDDTRPVTFVRFYCKEYLSVEDDDNSIKVEDGVQVIQTYNEVTTLEAPVLKAAELHTGMITVSWEPSVGAHSYNVLRQTADTTWEKIATVSADQLSFDDVRVETGVTYSYTVEADNTVSVSRYDTYGVSCKFVAKPQFTEIKNGVGGVEITWTKTDGADGYVLYRRGENETQWTPVIERAVAYGEFYRDTNVVNGRTYEYDICSKAGGFLTENDANGYVITYLESPDFTSLANTGAGIELVWKAIENADYYVIYRRELGVDSQLVEYEFSASNTFTDPNVINGTTYVYSIQAVSSNGYSAYSKSGRNITRVPSTIVTAMEPMADGIQVSWEAAVGVSGYRIYRSTDGVEWQAAGSVDKATLTYLDKSAPSGKVYYYSVAPYIGNSEGEKICSANTVYFIRTPGNVSAENVKEGIQITWNVSAGATQYWVYRKTFGSTAEGTLVATVGINAGCTYIDENVDSGEIYCYTVKAISPKGNSPDGEYTAGTMRIACVTGVNAQVLQKGVTITWDEHSAADKYIVCRLENGEWKELATVSELTYTDKTAVSGTEYAYGVKAVVGDYKGGIDEDSIKTFLYIAAPTKLTATNGTDSTNLSWSKVDGAKYYVIYKSTYTSKGRPGEFKELKTIVASESTYVDKGISAGKKYGYIVYAKSGDVLSAASDECVNVFLSQSKIKKISNYYGGVKITWSDIEGAEYYVVSCKEAGGEWKVVKTLKSEYTSCVYKGAKNGVKIYYRVRAKNGNSLSSYTQKAFTHFASPVVTLKNAKSAITVNWKAIDGAKSYYVYRKAPGETSWKRVSIVTKTTYTDKDVKAGKTYTYTVKAYNGKIFSAYKTDGWKIKRLTIPSLTSATNNAGSITIKWQKVTGATGYNVYRRLSGEKAWVKIGTSKSTSYVDKTAKNGKTYVYTVAATGSGSISAKNSSGISVKRLARPKLVSVKSGSKGVTFTWGEVTGASGYYVYRKTGSGSWQKIATVEGKTKVTYLDKSAKKGVTYTYTVKAYSGKSVSSYYKDGLKIKDKY